MDLMVRPMEAGDVDEAASGHPGRVRRARGRKRRARAAGAVAEHARIRFAHLLATDPGGCWVAQRKERSVGAAIAILREGLWGLSLLVVHPAQQSTGLGRELLARAAEYGRPRAAGSSWPRPTRARSAPIWGWAWIWCRPRRPRACRAGCAPRRRCAAAGRTTRR